MKDINSDKHLLRYLMMVSPASNRNFASLQSSTAAELIEVEGIAEVQLNFDYFDTARIKSSIESVCPG